MKLKCVGFVHNKGQGVNEDTGEVFEFDSVSLDCLTAMSPKGKNIAAHGGEHYKKVKFKACDLSAVFGGEIAEVADLSAYIGQMLYVDGTQYNTKSGSYVNADEIKLA